MVVTGYLTLGTKDQGPPSTYPRADDTYDSYKGEVVGSLMIIYLP